MFTIKEVSEKLDVTPATIYNHLKRIESEIKPNLKKKKGVTHVNEEGVRQLKISMGLLEVPEVQENLSMEVIINDISNEVSKELKGNFESLESQIGELREQNKRLIEILEERESKTFIHKLKNLFRKE